MNEQNPPASRPDDPDETSRRSNKRPSWAGPRNIQTGVHVPYNRTVASSARARIVLTGIRVYPEGCLIEVEAGAHTVDESPDDLMARYVSEAHEGIADSALRFGIRFRDAGEATTTDHVLSPATEPEPPVLRTLGGPGYHIDGMNIRTEENLWLWPAPPAETFDFTAQWPAFGIPLTSTTIDGEQLHRAATGSK